MRRVLAKVSQSYFCTWKSSNLYALANRKVKQAQALQKNNYGQISKIFLDLYMKDLTEKEKIGNLQHRSNKYCLMQANSVEKILKEFLQQSSYYSELHLVAVFQQLKNAVNVSRQDNASSFSKDTNKLFYEPHFDHLIEQFKFAMRDDVYLSWPGMLKILKCCVELGYIDDDILLLLMRKIERKLGVFEDNEENQLRYYQIEKDTYYARGIFDAFEKISQNQTFTANIDTIRERVLTKKRIEKLANKEEKFEDPEIQQIINELHTIIRDLNYNVESFTEAVVTIRSQYRKLAKISGDQQVFRNYLLNSSLLQLQESLLKLGFIDIQDIKNPKEQKEVQKVLNILHQQFKKKNISVIQAFVGVEDNIYLREKEIKQLSQLSEAYLVLAEIANMPCMIIKSKDGRTMISEKWERQLMNKKIYKDTWVYADRIFRKVYKQSVLFARKDIQEMKNKIVVVPIKFSFKYINSLCNLGLHEQAQSIVREQKDRINQIKFDELENDELFALVGIMNNLSHINSWDTQFLSNFNSKLNQYLKQYSLMDPYNREPYQQFYQLADILKFYAIHGRQSLIQKQKLAQVAVGLKLFVQNYESSPFFYRKYVEGVRLLSVDQNLAQSENKKFHIKYIQSIEKAKNCQKLIASYPEGESIPIFDNRNPFLESFQKLCLQFSHGSKMAQIPYFTTGFNHDLMTGAMLAKDTDCSLGGRHFGSGLRAYLARVSEINQSSIKPIAISRFLDIDYHQNKIQTKEVEPIQSQLRQVFEVNSDKIRVFSELITSRVWNIFFDDSGPKKIPHFDRVQLKRIVHLLNNVLAEHYENKKSLSKNHHGLKQAKIVVLLLNLKKELSNINSNIIKTLNNNEEKPILKQLDDLIKQISKDIPENLLKVENQQDEKSFVGKRLTIQTVQTQQPFDQMNWSKQLIDSIYFHDSRYVQYQDWQQLLTNKLMYKKFYLHETSSTVRLLAKVFLPKAKESIEIIPYQKQEILETPYPFHWQNTYTRRLTDKQAEQAQQMQNIVENQKKEQLSKRQKHILTMLNFKHQLKMTKQPNEIVDYILGFDFINNLIKQKNQSDHKQKLSSNNFLYRNFKKYFQYLQKKYQKIYFESPYMEYILSKISPTEEIKELMQQRANARVKGQSLYQLGQITKQEYYKAIKVVQDKIISKLEAIKNKSLDYTSNTVHEGGLKMVQLEKNIQQFSRLFQRANIYKLQTDPDIDRQSQSFNTAFQIKRSKAEDNLIRFYLIKKMASGDKLTEQQKQYIKNWKRDVKQGNKSDRKVSNLKISNISENDKKKIKLQLTDLNGLGQVALNQLIIELNHFLDERVIQEVQRNMFIRELTSGVQIPKQLFQFTSNKQFAAQSLKKEAEIFDSKAKLNQKDIDHLIQLVSILKVQSPFMRKKFNDIYKQFRPTIELMNEFPCRKQLISQFCDKLEVEYHSNYYTEYNKNKKMAEAQDIWNSIFQNKQNKNRDMIPNEVTTQQISAFCQKLSSRLFILKKNVPPFFGQLILNILKHPQTSPLTKQTLLGRLQLFKIPIVIDSQDVASLCDYIQKKQPKQKIDSMQLLPRLAQQNFSQKISNKMIHL